MSRPALRKTLSAPGLLSEVRRCFQALKDDTAGRGFQLADYLMSGLAVFGLKYPSLLQFDADRDDEIVRSNLKSLYGIDRAPSDTALRERLDEVDPSSLRRAFRRVLHLLQRGMGLEDFLWWAGHYLLSVDGTGYFYSGQMHCEQRCEKRHRDGRVSYYCHQLLGAALAKQGRKRYFREKLRGFFFTYLLPDWETLYRALAYGAAPTVLTPYDTS